MGRPRFPPYPPFHSLRLATAADVMAMADLSVLGFKDSEIFRFERPRYAEFPQDAINSFANLYRNQLLSPLAVVIVAEDWERSEAEPHFPAAKDESPPDGVSAKRIVVGTASWILPEGSRREGQFVAPDVGDPLPAPDRDLCQRRLALFTRISEATEKRYFTGMMVCNKLVVHPSYQQRGHATSMLLWGQRLADLDAVDQGVIPSHVGEPVYRSLGYEVIGEMTVPDDGEVKGFTQRVVVYRAKQVTGGEDGGTR